MDIKESDILDGKEDSHWYYRAKARAMVRFLGTRTPTSILDVGAGSGFFSKHLLKTTTAERAICVDTAYAREWENVEFEKSIQYKREIGSVDVDLTLMMDVLEHVDDDVGLLRMYADKTPKNSRFLISVPAFQFLWSEHDVFLEHKRRYTLNQLEDVVRRAGFVTEHGAYYFAGIFPLVSALRVSGNIFNPNDGKGRSQLQQHSPLVNTFFSVICGMEMPFMRLNRLAGLTAFCLARSS